jgi:serine/threonine protein kinase
MDQSTPRIPGYAMEGKLNRGGGMTDLFLATDARGERVVVRCPKPAYARDAQLRAHFASAADILARIHDPHVVSIRDAGQAGDRPYMVLSYIPSQTLRELIVHRNPSLRQHSLSVMRQLATALYVIHHAGFLHLDIKPENVLITPEIQVVVIDFDLARPIESKPTRIRNLPGTPTYLAPETLARQRVDERSDIFSFGITAYEAMTFHKPFPGRTPEELLAAQMSPSTPPIPARVYRPEVPPAVESILSKCLAKIPDQRYPSMSLVVKELKELA